MQVTFGGHALTAKAVQGGKEMYQGTRREYLEFVFAPEGMDIGELDALFAAGTEEITLTDGESGEVCVHGGYVVRGPVRAYSLEDGSREIAVRQYQRTHMEEMVSGIERKTLAQATIAAMSIGAEVQLTPEIVAEATQGADIAEAEPAAEWRPGVHVGVGVAQTYKGKTYECIQAHVTLANWPPDLTPALWVVKQAEPAPGETLPWVAGEAVKKDDKRTFGGATYECLQGHTTQAGWEPPSVAALWKKVG